MRAASRYVEPRTDEELARWLTAARREGLSVTFRGAGRSYGDAALNTGGLVVDLRRLNGVRQWDPLHGVMEAGPGLTIEGLWRRTIQDGYWPAVVPGTMHPTLGGCLSMNVHGKNNYRAGVVRRSRARLRSRHPARRAPAVQPDGESRTSSSPPSAASGCSARSPGCGCAQARSRADRCGSSR